MRWIKELENCNISFQIHVLQKQDSIFIKNKHRDKNIMHVLDGFIKLVQIFTNNEKICLRLICKNQTVDSKMLNNKSQQKHYYYLLVAITETAIVTIPSKEFYTKTKRNKGTFLFLQAENQCKKNEMISILSHKNTKKRVIQLIIILVKQFGHIKKSKIIVPFDLTHQLIATIVGSQRTTVNKIMSTLKQKEIISYGNKNIIINNITQLIHEEK